jgi:hypothetical protein
MLDRMSLKTIVTVSWCVAAGCASMLAASPAKAASAAAKSARATSGTSVEAKPGAATTNTSGPEAAKQSGTMTMRGGQDGTAFQSLTVQGEDRVHFEIERPPLDLTLDPTTAPGLDWGSPTDVLDRTVPDGVAPMLSASSSTLTPFLARPWLRQFSRGDVARFHPQLEQVESWRLTVADSRGTAVRSFEGKGKPPEQIVWDGRSSSGQPVQPGLTYSYVLEARDRAGNKRNFVGQGFKVAAYGFQSADGPVLAFTNPRAASSSRDARLPSGLVLEAASWLNQSVSTKPVRITATARSFEAADALANETARGLTPLLLGNPARVQTQVQVQPDAYESGAVQIAPAP